MSEINNDLNEVFEEEMDDATVITVPIDDTLSNSGEAADAAAVGAALALKADLADVKNIKVNDEEADNQGQILIDGTGIPVSGEDTRTLAEAIESAEEGKTADEITMSAEDETTVAARIIALEENTDGIVKSVNGTGPDGTGNVTLRKVPLADNLDSSTKQSSLGEYIIRTAGGEASISDGPANLMRVMGNTIRTGYEPESIEFSVSSSSCDASITDMDMFRAQMGESGTLTLTYTSDWDEDPESYGITVVGTPEDGDTITAVWEAEERGTITNATPTGFSVTGWNLYIQANGYARVVKYSDEYGYAIAGSYTKIEFAETIGGARTDITPASGIRFNVPADGYVFVTGGGMDTAIWATWSDWTTGYAGEYEAYNKQTISLAAIVGTLFPNGMCKVGSVMDYIDIERGFAYKWIDVMEYSAANLAIAQSSGRSFTYDTNNIYLARASATITALTGALEIDGSYNGSDHGLEMFEGTSVPAGSATRYGLDLRNKLERDVLTISQQTLTAAQKEQVRENIGAAAQADLAKIGTYPAAVNGQYTTAAWSSGSWTAEWTAPEDGVYLAYMWIQLNSEYSGPAYRKYYRQLQMGGTCTRLFQNMLYYDTTASNESAFEGRCITQPIYARAGQTLYPYIHTDAAGCLYDYKIFCIRIA